MKERLRERREGTGRRTILLVLIVDPVRVGLDLVVVEVEVRRVVEANIRIRSFVSVYPWHRNLKVFPVGNK